MYCSTCGDERRFERTPCLDGHGADCPERACVECGAAVLVGPDSTLGDHAVVTSGDQVDVTQSDGGTSRPSLPVIPGPLPSASTPTSPTPASPVSIPNPTSAPSDPASHEPSRTERASARAVA
ncbi:hypothetical protein [Actinomadura oligospora]|uniref:hypothetical protein n=1 Tax=Actinomadura oligospora TaxID=111804 RepID=UPI0004B2C6E0|nr:hypothetical protein [Actinomadura oligospora]